MINVQKKKLQTINILFSSGAIILLVTGIIIENWVELTPKVKSGKIIHNPWMPCCPAIWPEDTLKLVRSILRMSLNISVYINLIMGLQFTSMISQNKCMNILIALLNFFTGFILLFAVVLYHHKLRKGKLMYHYTYKIKGIFCSIYLPIIFFIICGVLCIIQCTKKCACIKVERESKHVQERSIKVNSLPEHTVMPRSIVHVHTENSKEEHLSKSQVQARRVTWAL